MDEPKLPELKVGNVVWDDLTQTKATILKVEPDAYGNIGVWLDNDWVGGGRHPWEISPWLLPTE